MAKYGFVGLTVDNLTKKLVKDWILWLAKKGLSGDKINKACIQGRYKGKAGGCCQLTYTMSDSFDFKVS